MSQKTILQNTMTMFMVATSISTPRSALTLTPSILRYKSSVHQTSTRIFSAPAASGKKVITRRVLSGVQPSGSLHLGNYLGAIRQWVDFQNAPDTTDDSGNTIKTENYFCVVDLHAITVPHVPDELTESTLTSAAVYLAAGIDPDKSTVFVQSHVSAHSELTWLLNCITPLGWLERMIQFKEKAVKQGESVGVALLDYPVLMAADILLYQADQVPVGEDQQQHIQLAREIVRRFHHQFCKGNAYKRRCKATGIPSRPVFVEPEAMFVENGARVMSLTDGTSKMSKSDPSDSSRINLLDPPDVVHDKIKRCKTDVHYGLEWDNPERPESTNLLNIFQLVQPGRTREDILHQVGEMSWGEFKPILAEAVSEYLRPIQDRYYEIREDDQYLRQVLRDGARSADEIASRTLRQVRVAMGLVPPVDEL